MGAAARSAAPPAIGPPPCPPSPSSSSSSSSPAAGRRAVPARRLRERAPGAETDAAAAAALDAAPAARACGSRAAPASHGRAPGAHAPRAAPPGGQRWALALGLFAGGRRALGQYNGTDKIETAMLYGSVNEYAYYFTELYVGAPEPQKVSVIVDTGSSLCGFPCEGCAHCGDHLDRPFDIQASQSATFLPCGSQCAGTCREGRCGYAQSYTEGSSIAGVWFRDEVRLGDSDQRNPSVNATLGCHVDERNLFYTQRVNGIMGMAPHENGGWPTILQDLFVDKRHVSAGIFALCLSEWGGRLTVGGHDPAGHAPGREVQWIELRHSGYYSVALSRLSVGSEVVGSDTDSFGVALVDSGTTFSYFPREVHARMLSAIEARCGGGGCGARHEPGEEDCWRLDDGATEPAGFPAVAMRFDAPADAGAGLEVEWPPRAYLFQRGDPGLWCHAFASNGPDDSTVLGISWLLHKDVIFDLVHSRLGVVEAECPRYSRPGSDGFGPLGALVLDDASTRPLVVKVLNVLWIVCSIGAVVGLGWFTYVNWCDVEKGVLYHNPGDDPEGGE